MGAWWGAGGGGQLNGWLVWGTHPHPYPPHPAHPSAGEKEGYKILPPPAGYKPIVDPAKKLMATPTPMMTPMYAIPEDNPGLRDDLPAQPEGLPEMKPEDMQYFSKLLQVGGGGRGGQLTPR